MFLPFYTIQTVAVSPSNLKLVQKLVRSIVLINAFNFHNESNNRFFKQARCAVEFFHNSRLIRRIQKNKIYKKFRDLTRN